MTYKRILIRHIYTSVISGWTTMAWLVVGERVFEGQACCRKFGPAGRAAAGASTHPAASASFRIVSVKVCSHSRAAFRTVRCVDNPREVVDVH